VGVAVGIVVGVGVATGVPVGVAVGVGVGGAPSGKAAENSDVLLAGSVAVAEKMVWPEGTGKTSGPKVALQEAFVVTLAKPMNVCPSPSPLGSALTFEKNSIR
jgi:hypothetical protein